MHMYIFSVAKPLKPSGLQSLDKVVIAPPTSLIPPPPPPPPPIIQQHKHYHFHTDRHTHTHNLSKRWTSLVALGKGRPEPGEPHSLTHTPFPQAHPWCPPGCRFWPGTPPRWTQTPWWPCPSQSQQASPLPTHGLLLSSASWWSSHSPWWATGPAVTPWSVVGDL